MFKNWKKQELDTLVTNHGSCCKELTVCFSDMCKELLIDFKRPTYQFDAFTVNSKELELVNHTKVLGITIPSTLQWNCHISGVIKKANKQLFFLILLKRAKVLTCDFISFYHTCITPVLDYCAP